MSLEHFVVQSIFFFSENFSAWLTFSQNHWILHCRLHHEALLTKICSVAVAPAASRPEAVVDILQTQFW